MEEPLPRVVLLGAGPDELELLADLHASHRVEIAGVHDSDPLAPGLGLAEVLGIATGSSAEFRARFADTSHRILPSDPRRAADFACESWNGETLTLESARRRWGGGVPVPQPRAVAAARTAALASASPAGEPAVLADLLLDEALRAVGANGGSLQRLAIDTGELYVLAARGLSEKLVRWGRHRLGEGIAGTVAATRAPRLLHGAKPGRVARERGEIASSISIPLDDAAGLFGVLNVSTTLPGRTFDDEHVRALQSLAPRLVELLRAAEAADAVPGADAAAFARLLRNPVETAAAFDLRPACDALRERLQADGLRLAFATDDGNWRILATSGMPIASPAPSRARMTRALLEDCWLHANESAADAIDVALERVLADGLSRVYAPLNGLRPVGVMILDFRSLGAAEASLRRGRAWVAPLGLAVEAVIRGRAQERRVSRLSTLAHFPKAWRGQGDALLPTLARQAAQLLGARAATVRRCDEQARTYTRPATHGIEPGTLPAWRRFDLQVTEHTLTARHSSITTAAGDESDALTDATPRRSLVTAPMFHDDSIVGIINVYDREDLELSEPDAFTPADRELLETFASLAAPFVATALDPAGEIAAAPGPAPALAPPAPLTATPANEFALIATRLEEILGAAPVQPVQVVLLRFTGLRGSLEPRWRERLAARAQACLNASDTCGWSGAEDLLLLTRVPGPEPAALAERVLAALRPLLARFGAEVEVDVRVGTSRAPADGLDALTLIETAGERAG